MNLKLIGFILIFLCSLSIPASAQSVYYPAHGNGEGTFNTYTGVTCTNLGASSPCARYNEGTLRIDMDLDTVKYQVQNKLGEWRYIQYDISNPTNLIPTPSNNPKSLTWMNMYANNTNLRYVMQSHGIKLDIWGSGTPPSNYFNFTYTLSSGVTHRMQGEEILFMDTVTGEPLWLVKYPTMNVNGTNVPLTFKRDGNKISIHAPDLFTNPEYNFSAGWELDPSTQSGNTIYISDRHNLTEVNADIANASALQSLGSGEWLLNANLINNNTANSFYINETDTTWLKINSTNTSGTPTFWYYLTQGKTEINNTKITSWNTTSNTVENLPVSTWARSAVYASGASSKMNISNSNLSYLGYSVANMYGVCYISSSGNIIYNNSFLQNFIGIFLQSSSNNNLTNNTGTSTSYQGIQLYSSSNNNILTSNTGTSNTNAGILLHSSSNNNLTSNTGTSNTNAGILLQLSSNNNLTSNTGTSNTNAGIQLYLSSNNNLTSNTGTSGSSYGIYLISSSNNNLTSNTGTSGSSYGIYLISSSNNNLTSNTGTSNTNAGILLQLSSNNNLTSNIFNTNSTISTLGDIYLRNSFSNNTFNLNDYSKPRKITFYDNVSQYNMSNNSLTYVSTQNIGTSLTGLTTNRTLYNWTQNNITFSETWTEAKEIQYNVSGLAPNTYYQIYNGTSVNYIYVSDSSGIITPFTINFTTSVTKTIKIIEIGSPIISSWGNSYTGDNQITFSVAKNTNITFNATADQTITTWNWVGATEINGSSSPNSYAYQNYPTSGIYTVTVNGTNAYGTTDTVTWSITVGLSGLSLNGYVNNSLGVYLENARVDFNSEYNFTNSSGYYEFNDLGDNSYTILVRAIGYSNYSDTLDIVGNTTLNLTLNERSSATVEESVIINLGFIGGIIGGIIVISILRKKKDRV